MASATLGAPVTQGSLTITIAGPVTTSKEDAGTLAAFKVTMTNTGTSGAVVGPDAFGIRCDANRDDNRPGDMMAASTIKGDRQILAGQKATGTAVLAWLTWDKTVKCTGPTTVEAQFLQGGFLSWTLPQSVVDQVNKAAGAA